MGVNGNFLPSARGHASHLTNTLLKFTWNVTLGFIRTVADGKAITTNVE